MQNYLTHSFLQVQQPQRFFSRVFQQNRDRFRQRKSLLDRAIATRAGEEKIVAVLFSDVADSTSMSEKLSPYDLL